MARILTLTNWYPPHRLHGSDIVCHQVMTRLAGRGHQVEVLCSEERLQGVRENPSSVRVRRSLQVYSRSGDVWSPSLLGQIRIEHKNQRVLDRALTELSPDVVAVWHTTALSLNLLSTIIGRKIPIVYAIRHDSSFGTEGLDPWSRRWQRSPLRRAAGLALQMVGGPPAVIPDLGAGGVACFDSEVTRNAIQKGSLWQFTYSPVVPLDDLDRATDVFERWYVASSAGMLSEIDPMSSDSQPRHERDPLLRHQAVTSALLREREDYPPDEQAVKSLYRDLGDSWWELHSGARDGPQDQAAIPVLSAPETTPVVVTHLCSIRGLVLDAGCGPNPAVTIGVGRTEGKQMVAMDIGLGTVRVARAKAQEAGVEVLPVVGDVERLPFRSESFDGLVCDDTIEHLPDDRGGVGELRRVLKPSGLALLATPNRHNGLILRERFGDWWRGRRRPASHYYVANSHLREYTWREFGELIDPFFMILDSIPIGWGQGRKRRAASHLLIGPLRRVSQIIVLEARPRLSPSRMRR